MMERLSLLSSSWDAWEIGLALASSGAVVIVAAILHRRRRTDSSSSASHDTTSPTALQLGRRGQKEVAKKQYLAAKHHQQNPTDNNKATTTSRRHAIGAVPPGNFNTTQWIQTDLGLPLPCWHGDDPDQWKLTLVMAEEATGTVDDRTHNKSIIITFADLQKLDSWPTRVGPHSWNCVTGWTCHNLVFYGVLLQEVLDTFLLPQSSSSTKNNWKWLYQTSADGYTAPIHREDLANAYLVVQVEQPQQQSSDQQHLSPTTATTTKKQWIGRVHGGPRIVVDSLWGWKSAKWLTEVELLTTYRPGFWESISCHARGRVYDATTGIYMEERWTETGYWSTIMPVLTSLANLYHLIAGVGVYRTVLQVSGGIVGWMSAAMGVLHPRHEKSI